MPSSATSSETIKTELLDFENHKHMGRERGVTTVTFFRGDYTSGCQLLRERVRVMLESNRWLLGTLNKNDKGRLTLDWDPKCDVESLVPSMFFALTADQLPVRYQGNDFAKLNDILKSKRNPGYVPRGTELIGNGARLFRVTVVQCEDDESVFAVVVSFSHTIADGHTYYTILNMLWDNAPVKSMKVERCLEFCEESKDVVGREEAAFFAPPSKLVMVNFAMKMLRMKLSRQRGGLCFYYIDNDKVQTIKETIKKEGEVPFVSTNDIITSSFLRMTGRKVKVMAVNLRNRVEACPTADETRAGNYESALMFLDNDADRPALIRKAMMKQNGVFRRCGDVPTKIPEGMEHLTFNGFSMITNWSSSAKDMKLTGFDTLMHLPVGDFDNFPREICVIFRAGNGRLAVMCAGPRVNAKVFSEMAKKPDEPFGEPFINE